MSRSDSAALAAAAPDIRQWPRILARYREPSLPRSLGEIGATVGPLVALWVAMWLALQVSVWLSLLMAAPTAGFLLRLFLIQHDCSHDAFFRRRVSNAWVGRVIGVLTLTPHDFWRRTHAIHHSTSGNLDHRGLGDVDTLTVSEYLALPWWGRLRYRLYRNPVVMFGLGPAYVFIIRHRLPFGLMRGEGWQPWVSTMATNAAIATLAAGFIWLLGLADFLLLWLPVVLVAASVGVWLFFVQHQFEEAYWEKDHAWDHPSAALHGSSHYDLPAVLRWLTANIGIHHVHHLASRIPFYRLPEVLRDHPELADVGRLTLLKSFACVKLTLWDETKRRMISFRALGAARQGG